MPRVADLPCAYCGKMMWRGTTSLPEGRATCQPCRRAGWQHGTRKGYRDAKCRCDRCLTWNRENRKAYKAARLARDGVSLRVQYRKTPDVHCARCGDRLRFGGGGAPTGVEVCCLKCSRGRRRVTSGVRRAIYERDGMVCQLCNEPTEPGSPQSSPWYPTLDHIIPVSKGGTDDPSNLRVAHRWCNGVRGADDRHADLFEEAS